MVKKYLPVSINWNKTAFTVRVWWRSRLRAAGKPATIALFPRPAAAASRDHIDERAAIREGRSPHRLVGGAVIRGVRLLDAAGNEVRTVSSGEETVIEVFIQFECQLINPAVGFIIRRSISGEPTVIYDTNTIWRREPTGDFSPGEVARVCYYQRMDLGAGHYSISTAVASCDGSVFYDWREAVIRFNVIGTEDMHGIANLHSRIEIDRGG